MKPIINKIVIQLEEIHQEIGHKIDPPSRKVTIAAVIKNPYAKQYIEDLEELDLGELQRHRLLRERFQEYINLLSSHQYDSANIKIEKEQNGVWYYRRTR